MTTNWSLLLNLALLAGVVLILMYKLRKKNEAILPMDHRKPSITLGDVKTDDIIAIRKVDAEAAPSCAAPAESAPPPRSKPAFSPAMSQPSPKKAPEPDPASGLNSTDKTLMLFLLAKPDRQLAGYEMLQSILAAGLRFGEGQLFHRHQFANGQGPIICSLAAATPTGTFDLQNIGAFNAKGLCLFMHLSGSPTVDTERLETMLQTAYQLAEGLDTYLLDDKRKPLTPQTEAKYRHMLDSLTLNEA